MSKWQKDVDYSIPTTVCAAQVKEAKAIKRMIQCLFEEHSQKGTEWENGFLPLLCSLFTAMDGLDKLISEQVSICPTHLNEKTSENSYLIGPTLAETYYAHVQLMAVEHTELIYKYGFSFTIH
tara:strand:+ start:10948 stop:11316 length:369 start_codon:yes stop_codon:yes gene_type:complete